MQSKNNNFILGVTFILVGIVDELFKLSVECEIISQIIRERPEHPSPNQYSSELGKVSFVSIIAYNVQLCNTTLTHCPSSLPELTNGMAGRKKLNFNFLTL